MIEKFIESLRAIENPTITTGEELKSWQSKALNIVVRVYGEDSVQDEQIRNVQFETYTAIYTGQGKIGGGNNSKQCQKYASEVIQGMIADLETFGLPAERVIEKTSGINISLTQNQHVTVKVILDLLKDELTGNQMREVSEILKSDTSVSEKKNDLLNKLKSFGKDVAANILANILTNPSLYGG